MRKLVSEVVKQELEALNPQYPQMESFSETALEIIDQLVSQYKKDK
ncbi:MAG: hypothetical protein L3J52_02165 [Proteobacteria bacterium]|nr:hypothetical protein [Pseudomonadota bacterium]